jgi:uncharacterized membrane protein
MLCAAARRGALTDDALKEAVAMSGLAPEPTEWRAFLSRVALGLGSLAVGVGVGFLIAAHWDVLGRFGRLGLLAATIAALAAAAAWCGPERAVARALLLLAALLIGPLLAIIGQTYHTGAGVEKLLLVWAVLCVPWAVGAQRSWFLALPLVLLNASIAIGGGMPEFWLGESRWLESRTLPLLLLNAAAVVLIMRFAPDWRGLRQLALALALAAGTTSSVVTIAGDSGAGALHTLIALLHVAALAATIGWWWPTSRLDVVALGLAGASLIACLQTLLTRIIGGDNFFSWLILGLALVGMGGALASVLRARLKAAAT